MSRTPLELSSPPPGSAPFVRKGAGKPRFRPNLNRQLDAVYGNTEAQVAPDHLARVVLAMMDRLDTSALESQYSSMGRHGLHPRSKLAVLVYASLVGVHEATKIAQAASTDAAYRLLTGGYPVSPTMIRTFRRENEAFFKDAIEQTIRLAAEAELIATRELAVDSVRLRADASTKSIRTLARSEERLAELALVDTSTLDAPALATHHGKVEKHEAAIKRCHAEGRTSLSITNDAAALIKFPSGAALPGHRVTVVAAGTKLRFVLAVLIGSAPTDNDLLRPAMDLARTNLAKAGIDRELQVAGDAGFRGHDDLQYAIDEVGRTDVLLHDPPQPRRGKAKVKGGYFSKAEFDFRPDGSVLCPAKTPMAGPVKAGAGKIRYRGVGCSTCPLQRMCTSVAHREIIVDLERERLHSAMRARMEQPGAAKRYGKRIATVEPVFSYIEAVMKYQRASSRHAPTVRAEILLKILAYNLYRLFFCAQNQVVLVEANFDGRRFATTTVEIARASDVVAAWS